MSKSKPKRKPAINMQQRAYVVARPGSRVLRSGQYRAETIDGVAWGFTETTLVKGDTAPPTPKKGLVWALRDPTQHKSADPNPSPPDDETPQEVPSE